MNTAFKNIVRVINLVVGLIPTRLPQGLTQFEVWANGIITTYNLPSNDSVRFSLATMVMHLGPTTAFKPKFYFALSIWKASANQVVYQVIQDLKAKQDAEKKKLEVTQIIEVASNESAKFGV